MIGAPLYKLLVTDYDPNWPHYFDIECKYLKKAIGRLKYIVEHVGSTSLNKMRAQPIVDIIIGVGNDYDLITAKDILSISGYDYDAKKSSVTAYAFHRDIENKRYFNIILTKYNSRTWRVYTGVRDYFNSNPEMKKEYEALKLDLVQGVENDKGRYEKLKRAYLIDEVLPKINY